MLNKKVIDLTLPINNKMSGVSIEPAKIFSVDGWNATTLHLYSHSGTHMDAPLHFEVNEQTIDELPTERLISEAWIVDLRRLKPKAIIEISDLDFITKDFQAGQSIILHTGWSKRLGTPAYRDDLPRISSDLAHWLGEKGVNILGVEPPSVADVNNMVEVTEIHNILMKNNIIIVEGLCNLEQITKSKVTLIALPLKLEGGDGAPSRVIALED
tara:strand:+ start:18914 stop:19552 length:639 start_codon:yes stop_codon:yes gene_type:complete